MLRRVIKVMAFFLLVGSVYIVLDETMVFQKKISLAEQVNIPEVKSQFLSAIETQDLEQARLNYETLKKHLPDQDEFIVTIAPAYMADLYIQYAKRMSYNEDASRQFLEQARVLAPEHPYLNHSNQLQLMPVITRREVPVEDEYEDKLALIADEIQTLEETITQEETALELELAAIEEAIEPVEAIEIAEVIDVPEVPEVLEAVEVVEVIEVAEVIPETKDACVLAFYTRDSPLSACVDSIAQDYYGPALFVIAADGSTPQFAFTQAPVTYYEYQLFCQLSGQCYEESEAIDAMVLELEASGIDLDLTEVQQTVHDYNRYCQMTHLCKTIDTPSHDQKTLSKGEMQRYALWLTKQTGNRYRLLTDDDSKAIYQYFQSCMHSGECSAGMIEQLAIIFKDKNLLLVREL